MDVLFLLIPVSIVFLSLAVTALMWSIKSGQYDDLDSPAHQILFDDDDDLMPDSKESSKQSKSND